MADGNITMKLRAALAATAVLGLGGALAPGHAEESAPAPAVVQPQSAGIDLPRFEPAPEPAKLIETAAIEGVTDTAAQLGDVAPAVEEEWEPVGGGIASWYGPKFAGRRTASGETFDPTEYTAAHRTLPFGSTVRVTTESGKSVVVRINDRGPFTKGRVIDVSQAAARDLGLIGPGHGRVTLALRDE
jgi:rare lipoprotein A